MSDTGFGSRLRHLREAAGLTQKQLADRLGVGPSRVSDLERGHREPGWRVACQIADALGVSVEQFRSK
jgi:transcriptional regulator with XRE-family HTH domain